MLANKLGIIDEQEMDELESGLLLPTGFRSSLVVSRSSFYPGLVS
nr:hypothetical protein [Pectobacterium parmentieri]